MLQQAERQRFISLQTALAQIGSAQKTQFLKRPLIFMLMGKAGIVGAFKGNILSPQGALRDVALTFDGDGGSWQEALNDFAGELRVDIVSATSLVRDAPFMARMNSERLALIFGSQVSSITASGKAILKRDANGISLLPNKARITLGADNGAALSINPLETLPFYQNAGSANKVNFAFDIMGAAVAASGTLNANTLDQGWRISSPIEIREYQSRRLSLGPSTAVIEGLLNKDGAFFDVALNALINDAAIGRLSILNTPLAFRFRA